MLYVYLVSAFILLMCGYAFLLKKLFDGIYFRLDYVLNKLYEDEISDCDCDDDCKCGR